MSNGIDPGAILGASGAGTPEDPWRFVGASGQVESTAFRDRSSDPPMLIVQVGKQSYRYAIDCLEDLALGSAPLAERRPAEARAASLRSRLVAGARQLFAVPGWGFQSK